MQRKGTDARIAGECKYPSLCGAGGTFDALAFDLWRRYNEVFWRGGNKVMDGRSINGRATDAPRIDVGSADYLRPEIGILDPAEEQGLVETPEDVAVLYSWANLHGAKYRDFSASRREYRAQMRSRAAETTRIEEEAKATSESQRAIEARVAAEAAKAGFSSGSKQRDAESAALSAAATSQASAESASQAQEAEARVRAHEVMAREAQALAQVGERAIPEGAPDGVTARGTHVRVLYPEPDQRERQRTAGGAIADPYQESLRAAVEHHMHKPAADVPLPGYAAGRISGLHAAAGSSRIMPASEQVLSPGVNPSSERLAEEQRLAAEADTARRAGSEARMAEQRFAEQQRIAERQRIEEQNRIAEQQRLAEQRRSAERQIADQRMLDVRLATDRDAVRLDAERKFEERRRHDEQQRRREEQQLAQLRMDARERSLQQSGAAPFSGGIPASALEAYAPVAPPFGVGKDSVAARYEESAGAQRETSNVPEADRRFGNLERRQDVAGEVADGRSPDARPDARYLESRMPEHRSVFDRAGDRIPGASERESFWPVDSARSSGARQAEFTVPAGRPAWLYESEIAVVAARSMQAAPPPPPPAQSAPGLADTLQQSREWVASRWFALNGVFDNGDQQAEVQQVRQKETRTPVLALFSLAGGVGKTSMVATLGRALAGLGEKTLLTDTTSYGLLPFYFGARELRPGTMRTFSPPSGSTDAPINLINMDVESRPMEGGGPGSAPGQDWLVEDITRHARGNHRVVIDLATGAGSLTRRILQLGPVVLVPVSPDLNSVISLSVAEQFFQNQTDAEGRAVKVYFLLNQFDASQPLHLDVREVLRQQLGDRLLPFVIRRSPAVSEALAEGMTVMDYAPNSPAAEDYMSLAAWVRTTSAPASLGFRGVRWSEQR